MKVRNEKRKLPAVNYYHKVLHLGCCNSPRSASVSSSRISHSLWIIKTIHHNGRKRK